MDHISNSLSRHIDEISKSYAKSRLVRAVCRLEYWWRRHWANKPLSFKWVESEGEPVGEPIDVKHLTLHDMMEHQARGVLTRKVLLEGVRANAIQVLDFKRVDRMAGITTIQPRWV
jgi:hypothetical protein